MQYAILDERNNWYDATDDFRQVVPKGHRIIAIDEAQSYSRSYQSPEQIRETISAIRWQKESQGIVVGEQPVSTLREEMPVWQGMLLDMTLRPGETTSFEYKPRGGENVSLTAQQVQRVYACFAWYVAACFATERQLASMIGNVPNDEFMAIVSSDLTWPQTKFDWVAR
jgi:hypothetical protein